MIEPEPTAPATPLPPQPPPRPWEPWKPWGPWASLGLAAAVFVVYYLLQAVLLFTFAVLWHFHGAPATGGGETGLLAGLARVQGLALAVTVIPAAPVATALLFFLAGLRRRPAPTTGAAEEAGEAAPVPSSSAVAAAYLGYRRPALGQVLGWGAATVGFMVGYDLLGQALGRPLVPQVMVDIYRTAGSVPLLVVALAVAAPLLEETLFRGFLLPGLAASRIGPAGAIVVTGLLWAGVHLQYDLFDMGSILVLGIAFGWARWRTGSTTLTMVLHALVNLVATAEMAWLVRGG